MTTVETEFDSRWRPRQAPAVWAIGSVLAFGSLVGHIVASFHLGVHWPILALWLVPVLFVVFGILVFVVAFVHRGSWRMRRENPTGMRGAAGRMANAVRFAAWWGALALKSISIFVRPGILPGAWAWDLVDVVAIGSRIRFEKRRPSPMARRANLGGNKDLEGPYA